MPPRRARFLTPSTITRVASPCPRVGRPPAQRLIELRVVPSTQRAVAQATNCLAPKLWCTKPKPTDGVTELIAPRKQLFPRFQLILLSQIAILPSRPAALRSCQPCPDRFRANCYLGIWLSWTLASLPRAERSNACDQRLHLDVSSWPQRAGFDSANPAEYQPLLLVHRGQTRVQRPKRPRRLLQ